MAGLTAFVVDDEVQVGFLVEELLIQYDFKVRTFSDPKDALRVLKKNPPDLVVTDFSMPGMTGIELLKSSKEIHPDTDFIIMTGYGTIESAVDATRYGALDYVQKPLNLSEFRNRIQRFIAHKKLVKENQELKVKLQGNVSFENIIGNSPEIQNVFQLIEKAAPTTANIFLHGESGTGKEMVARAIHSHSDRRNGVFMGVDCVALPSHLIESELFGHEKGAFTGADSTKVGLIEQAAGGTFFMDEITELDYDLQAKLLRSLQERQYRRVGGSELLDMDVRIVSATRRDPKQAVADGLFREDLYYRLNVVPIPLPALRSRKTDIPLLIDHFLKLFAGEYFGDEKGFCREAMKMLVEYEWPGNIRELKNAMERICILSTGDELTVEDLPLEIRAKGLQLTAAGFEYAVLPQSHVPEIDGDYSTDLNLPFKDAKDIIVRNFEKKYLENVLEQTHGNVSRAAKKGEINRKTFYRLLDKHGMHVDREDY